MQVPLGLSVFYACLVIASLAAPDMPPIQGLVPSKYSHPCAEWTSGTETKPSTCDQVHYNDCINSNGTTSLDPEATGCVFFTGLRTKPAPVDGAQKCQEYRTVQSLHTVANGQLEPFGPKTFECRLAGSDISYRCTNTTVNILCDPTSSVVS